jgi:hypothetical protein
MQTSNAQERKGGRHHCWDQRLQTGEEKEDHLHRHNYKNGDDGGVRRQSSVRFDIHIGFETETSPVESTKLILLFGNPFYFYKKNFIKIFNL